MMTIAEYRQTIESKYMDAEGFVTQYSHADKCSSGNGGLDTAIHHAILHENAAIELADGARLRRTYSTLWAGGCKGLLSRNAGRPDQNSWDNYIGACASGVLAYVSEIPEAIADYGADHLYIFQNEPGVKAFISAQFWRFPHLIAFMRLCAESGPFSPAVIARFIDSDGDGAGADQIRWLMAVTVAAKNHVLESDSEQALLQVAREKSKTLCHKYGSIQTMFSAYYGSSHPFANAPLPMEVLS